MVNRNASTGPQSALRLRPGAILVTGSIFFTSLFATFGNLAKAEPIGPLATAAIELRIFSALIDSLRCNTERSLTEDAECAQFLRLANETIANAREIAQNPKATPTLSYAILKLSMERPYDPQAFFSEPVIVLGNRIFAARLEKMGSVRVMHSLRDAYKSRGEENLKLEAARHGAALKSQTQSYLNSLARSGARTSPPQGLVLLSLQWRKQSDDFSNWTKVAERIRESDAQEIGLMLLIAEADRP